MSTAGIAVRAAAAVGLAVLLATTAHLFFFAGDIAWLNLIVWAVVGLAMGAASRRRSTAIWVDAVIGFTIVFSYSIMGYASNAPLLGALAPFALVALLGALGMAAAGLTGHSCRRPLHAAAKATRN
ncbi:MAG: hypothetical protein M3N26_05410 [Pseudomonadota bacterium]|nr:hypothetical protein [Pseudomonadota bacterium]